MSEGARTKLEAKWAIARDAIGGGRLSVIMPVYNLADTIEANVAETAKLFDSHGVRAELVPVDDGSADGTAAALARAAEPKYEHVVVKPVICKRNGGKGAALRAGFDASTGEYVMLLDGDLDINPKQTPFFFAAMAEKGADIVIGSKRHKRSVVQYPWHRRFVSWVYFTLVRIFVGLPITDTQTGMKLFRREVLGESLGRMLVKTYAFDLELLAIAHQRGAKIAEAPVVIRFGNKFGALKANTVKTMALDSLAVFYRLRVLRYYAKAEVPPKLDHDPLVSVVIACPCRSWMLDECLAALGNQSYRNFEVIVLPDDNSQLTTPNFKLSTLPTGKVRPAEKRNLGIKAAKGEIIAFIDDDAYPDAHWLEYAVRYFGDETIGAVGGPGVTPPGDSFLARMGGRVYDNLLVSGNYRYRYKAGGVRRDVDDYPSCNLFVRKSLLDSFGGYRTDFWPGEDTLLCKDIVDAGKRIVYDPWVVVCHHRRPLFGAHLRQLGRYAFHRGYFCKRYPSNSLRLSYFIPTLFVAYLFIWAILVAIPQPDIMSVELFCIWQGLISMPMLTYILLALLTSFSLNPAVWIITLCGVLATHVTYGVRFLGGLLAKKAPCEFIGKDHA
ncbi:MAG: glycosyltransferase [Kiritimatiellae bacterium]|nr:glycosyltransferase [Kiritimatiellia bacterium]